MNAPYGGDRGRTPGDGSGRPHEDPYAQDPYGQRPYEERGPAHGVPYDEDPSTVQFTGGPRGDEGNDPAGQPYGQQPHGARPPHAQHPENPPQHPQPPQVPQPQQPQPQGKPPQAPPQQGDAFAHLYRDQGHQGQSPEPPRPAQFSQQPPPPPGGPHQPQQPAQPPHPQQGPPPQQPPHHRQYQQAQQPYQASPQTAPPQPYPPEPGAPGAAEEPSAQTVNLGTVSPRSGEAAPAAGGGGGGGLLKSSAIMAAGTMVSRLTGFIRSAMIVAALGASALGDSYQLAITLPTMIYVLTVGGGLNSVFVPQLVRAMKEDDDGGDAYANRLLTLVAVILGLLAVAAVFCAPVLVRLMSVKLADNPAANEVTITFVRYCLPSIFFMGIHVVMGQILNARGRFGAMMWTPVLNNIVIIASISMFLWIYGTASTSELSVTSIPTEGIKLLGVGTLLGLVVQALAMIPYLRAAGFRIRPRFDWRGHGLGKAAKLAKWTILFVLANQAGVLVVSQLSTWAGDSSAQDGNSGTGYIAYSNAQLIWNMPQAIITVSVMAALLPRLSRAAADGDTGAVRDDISQGLRNSAVAIVPIAFGFVALGIPMCTMIYGSAGVDAARSMGYMLMAFGLGLIPFSVQYVVLRAFYAYEDTRTPFFNTVIVAAVNAAASALCFVLLPARWAVVGMAASYGLAYIIGVGIAWRRLRLRLGGDLDGRHVVRTYIRLAGASVPATLLAGGAAYGIMHVLGSGTFGSVAALVGGGIVLGAVFVLAAKRMRIEEMTAMLGMVRARLGR
ncbi:murein biosynthesis integral membrane protein MurJ [Streptomyces sp. NBC_01795]|uniref:murein biosynthesis integral membrane protein MurJ n=1 Tax=unclassified Streptomyces TaxID=2593676 RepID=UPI002DD9674F|nr:MULTISPECIES: murein biosynthesis integral membrane protein MurJ [unclassified Streptomyces]WSA93645.1 murein biosynthesis integral membrane protein MurJ [Streptomyces sp. NBC_01795]WSS13730.1 murein biosynthesis integral membrane protein MurJ [Streptomyces sp. NBC_01186]